MYQKAVELYEQFDVKETVALSPQYIDAYYNIGLTLSALHRKEEAQVCYYKIIELDPAHAKALYNIGISALGVKDYKLAAEMCRNAVKLQPNFAVAHNAKTIALRGLKEYDKALSCKSIISVKVLKSEINIIRN